MPWPKTGATNYHLHLGHLTKVKQLLGSRSAALQNKQRSFSGKISCK